MSEVLQLLDEHQRRKLDGVKMFRPLPHQEAVFTCKASETLLRGGNRSGKTVCSAMRFAAIARDLPITLRSGRQIEMRMPHQKGRPLLMWVVGFDLKHIGQTIYRVLCRPGLYQIIRDLTTREWRAFNPLTDFGRELECKPSMPLLPPSEIKVITWEHRGEKQFSTIELKNGTLICAFSSIGEVKAGDPVDEIWIDEAIKTPGHYPEWQARLSDKKGRIIWSSWPKRSNSALRELSRRARDVRENPTSKDSIAEIVLRFSDNPFIDDEEKAKRIASWSEDDRISRDEGEYALDSLKMYGNFSRELHCAYTDTPEADDALAALLRQTKGQPPDDWTRILALDPGTARPGVLLAAVPPPEEFGEFVVVYEEFYPGRINGADELAKMVAGRTRGQTFEWFIIDGHAARQTPMGMNITVGRNYTTAFRAHELGCRTSGSHFMPGSDDVLGRIGTLQSWMTPGTSGWPKLRIAVQRCPILCKQLENYEKSEQDGFIIDKPALRQEIDLAQCLEYIAARNPIYVPRPESTSSTRSSVSYRAYQRLKSLKNRNQSALVHCGPEAAQQA
jgi:hypothetical protein